MLKAIFAPRKVKMASEIDLGPKSGESVLSHVSSQSDDDLYVSKINVKHLRGLQIIIMSKDTIQLASRTQRFNRLFTLASLN